MLRKLLCTFGILRKLRLEKAANLRNFSFGNLQKRNYEKDKCNITHNAICNKPPKVSVAQKNNLRHVKTNTLKTSFLDGQWKRCSNVRCAVYGIRSLTHCRNSFSKGQLALYRFAFRAAVKPRCALRLAFRAPPCKLDCCSANQDTFSRPFWKKQ